MVASCAPGQTGHLTFQCVKGPYTAEEEEEGGMGVEEEETPTLASEEQARVGPGAVGKRLSRGPQGC